MSDFTAAMRHDPHLKPVLAVAQPSISEAILDALGIVRKIRQLTKSDCMLVA